jgi:bifunctional DNA-binding transcriptional regulator/antitoxin component of YhaV-PrlF toxin-antitoxin module
MTTTTTTNESTSQCIRHWTTSIDEEGILTFPDDLLDQLGWKEGDEINFIDQKDGSFALEKVNEVKA